MQIFTRWLAAHSFLGRLRRGVFVLSSISLLTAWSAGAQISFSGAQRTVPISGLSQPFGAAVDQAGNLYISDAANAQVLKIDVMGNQSTLAINPAFALDFPEGLAVDGAGNLFVCDDGNNQIVRIPAGGGAQAVLGAGLNQPTGIAVDSQGNLFVADFGNGRIVKITPGGSQSDFATGFDAPQDVKVDSAGNVYVADQAQASIVRIAASDGTQTNVGSGFNGPVGVTVDGAGNVYVATNDGTVQEVTAGGSQFTPAISGLVGPEKLAVDANYNLFIPDSGLGATRVVEFSTKTVNQGFANACSFGTVAPCDQTAILNYQTTDAISSENALTLGASFDEFNDFGGTCLGGSNPCSVTVDFSPLFPGSRQGAYLLVGAGGESASTPLYGTGLGAQIAFDPPTVGRTAVKFSFPAAVAVDGNGILIGNLYVLDSVTCQVFQTTAQGASKTVLAGNGTCSTADAAQTGVAATSISLGQLNSLTLDGAGNIYFSDTQNDLIRKVDTNGIITTVVGSAGPGFSGDGGPATNAQINEPFGLATDAAGNLYFSDAGNGRIRKVDLAGFITTVAGSSSTPGFGGDGGPATSAVLSTAEGISVDSAGNLFICDSGNNVIRRVDTSGVIKTVAGNQALGAGSSGDGGPATSAQLSIPQNIAVSAAGELFITDGNSIRRVDGAGIISTYSASSLVPGPLGVVVDGSGNLAVANAANGTIAIIDRTTASVPSFGTQVVGSPSPAKDVILTNTGNQDLTLSQITVPAGFDTNGSDTSCSVTTPIAAGQDCILGIEFAPTSAGLVNANVGLADNSLGPAASSTQNISVRGTGVTLTVTATTLSGSPNPSTFGQSVTLTASVTPPPAGSPFGTVEFFSGATDLGPGTVNASGTATLTTSSLALGSFSLTAVYSGNSDSAGSTSSALSFTVNQSGSSTALTALPNPSAFGQSVTLTATVTSATGGTPTGTVTFKSGATTIGAAVALAGSGVATMATTALPIGAQSLTAIYSGDTDTTTSTSNTVSFTVTKATSSTVLTAAPNPSTFEQSVTLTATVSSASAGTPTGTVTFKSNGTAIGSAVAVNGSGVATLATTALVAGAQNLTAVYSGDTDFALSTSNSISFTVNTAASTTALTALPNPSTFGQSVTLTATVTSAVAGAPTGTITFKSNGTAIGAAVAVNGSGVATLATSSLAGGAQNLTAAYSGDVDFAASTSNTVSFTVNTAASTTALTATPNPSAFGQSVTLTATVTSAAAGTPTGSVTFKSGGVALGAAVALNGSGVATLSTAALAIGAQNLTAVYSGDVDFAISTSNTVAFTVNKAGSTTALTALPNPSTFGQSVTLTATVTSATGTPTGSVTFKSGSTTIGAAAALNGSGVATLSTTALAIGAQSLTAVYSGDVDFTTSTSNTVAFTVNQAASTTALTALPNPSTFGQSVTLTATVTSATGTPTGSVTFKSGSTTIGAAAALNGSGVATLSTTALVVGAQNLTAVYSGDVDFTTSTSNTVAFTVNQAASTTALTALPNPSTFGQSVTLTATVTTATGTPTGSVTFKSGATSIGAAVALNGSGIATLSTAALAVGAQNLTAVYSGDVDFTTSTSNTVAFNVNQAGSTTALTALPNPSTFGQSVTLTATVASVTTGTPTGSVTFKSGGVALGAAVALNGSGVATMPTTALVVGAQSLTAVYSGDVDFTTSTSNTVAFTVNQAASATALTALPNPSTFGQSVTLTATVTSANGTPTGSITFKSGTTTIGAAVALNGSGVATLSTATLPVGAQSLTAVYSGDVDFVTSTSNTVAFNVTQAASTTALTALPNPSTFGQSVTLTATVTSTVGTPTGSVTFKSGGVALGAAVAINGSGIATLSTSALAGGVQNLTAVYSGDVDFVVSTSNTVSFTVTPAASSTALTALPNPSSFGQSVTLTATVTSGAAGTPTGSVTFKSNGTAIGAAIPVNGSGIATLATTALPGGAQNLTAVYSGDADFATSTSNTVSFTVGPAVSTTTLTATPNPSEFGQSVTISATISSAIAGTPTGTVTFKNNGVAIGAAVAVSGSGVATLATTTLVEGAQNLTAVYSGDASYAASTSNTVAFTVNMAPTSTVLTAPSSITTQQTATLTATVSATAPGAGTPTGTITFKNGATTIGAPVTLASSTATLMTTLPPGVLSLTAVYSGDTDFLTSTAAAQNVTVTTTTTTALSAAPTSSTFGQSVTLTATITPTPTGSALGTVNFFNGSTMLGSGSLNVSGTATFTSTTLPAGTLSLTAVYSGNVAFGTSTSPALGFTVTAATTTTSLAISPSPGTFGQNVTLTATIAPVPTGTTLGAVTFLNGATTLGTGTVSSSGVATFAISTLPAGNFTLTASYAGNGNFGPSTSTGTPLTVNTTFAIAPLVSSLMVAEGGLLPVPINVPPLGGPFNGVVTMSASGLPPGATGTFVPTTVTPGTTGGLTVFNIQLAPLAAHRSTDSRRGAPVPAFAFVFGLLVFVRRKYLRKSLGLTATLLLFALVGSTLMGCAGGFLRPPSTPPGAFRVTITGTSGTTTQTATVTVVVR